VSADLIDSSGNLKTFDFVVDLGNMRLVRNAKLNVDGLEIPHGFSLKNLAQFLDDLGIVLMGVDLGVSAYDAAGGNGWETLVIDSTLMPERTYNATQDGIELVKGKLRLLDWLRTMRMNVNDYQGANLPLGPEDLSVKILEKKSNGSTVETGMGIRFILRTDYNDGSEDLYMELPGLEVCGDGMIVAASGQPALVVPIDAFTPLNVADSQALHKQLTTYLADHTGNGIGLIEYMQSLQAERKIVGFGIDPVTKYVWYFNLREDGVMVLSYVEDNLVPGKRFVFPQPSFPSKDGTYFYENGRDVVAYHSPKPMVASVAPAKIRTANRWRNYGPDQFGRKPSPRNQR
jgi:hypothetical protein